MARWILLFVTLPVLELVLLLEIGARIGTLSTLGLIAVTGVLGASLARSQGLRVFDEVRTSLARGEVPAGSFVDGLLILIAAAVLLTPGVITDACGFALLVPAVRSRIKAGLIRRFERAVAERRVHVEFTSSHREIP